MSESQSRQCRFYQFGQKFRRAELHKPGRPGNQFRFPHTRANGENPLCFPEASLILDFAFVEIAAALFQGNQNETRGDHQFQMNADMLVQRTEAFTKARVVVKRQTLR